MKSGLALVVLAFFGALSPISFAEEKGSDPKVFPSTLSRKQVSKVLEKHSGSMRKCIKEQANIDPSVTGKLSFSMTIAGSGRVKNVELISEAHKGTHVKKCVFGILKKIKFPKFEVHPIGFIRISFDMTERMGGTGEFGVLSIHGIILYQIHEEKGVEHIDCEIGPPGEAGTPLSNSEVLEVMCINIPEFKECIRGQKSVDASVRGRMFATLVISPSGRVASVRVSPSQFEGTFVGNCVSEIIMQLKFREFSGEPKKVPFPFTVN